MLFNILWTIVGGVVGLTLGLSLIVIKNARLWIKTLIMVIVSFAFPIVCSVIHVSQAKYVGIIFFGYGTQRVWGENRPTEILAKIWKFYQPFLFGTIGAAILFRDAKASTIGNALIIICISVPIRVYAAFSVTHCTKFTLKERGLISLGWMPKGTVQAALSGIVLNYATLNIEDPDLKEEWQEYGRIMLTTGVFAIVLASPMGAMILNILGFRWLQAEVPEGSKTQ